MKMKTELNGPFIWLAGATPKRGSASSGPMDYELFFLILGGIILLAVAVILVVHAATKEKKEE